MGLGVEKKEGEKGERKGGGERGWGGGGGGWGGGEKGRRPHPPLCGLPYGWVSGGWVGKEEIPQW